MKTLLSLFLLSTAAFANACVSSASGNWNDSSKWTSCGGTVPGNGDTVTIATGHTITVPAGYQAIVGVSGIGGVQQTGGGPVPAIQCTAENTGTSVLLVNGTLTFRGNVEQCNAVWTVGPNAILEHDSSLASAPSTTHYRWIVGTYLFPDNAKMVIRGTIGHRALIRNAAGSGTFYGFTYNRYSGQGSGQVDFEYTTIDGCGGASPCVEASSHNSAIAFLARCDHCLVTNSGYFGAFISYPGGDPNVIRITNSTFTSPADANKYATRIVPSAAASVVVDTIYTTGVIYIPGSGGDNATGTHIRNVVVVGDGGVGNYPFNLGGSHFRVAEFDRVMRITDSVAASASTGTPAYLPGGALTRIMCLMNSNLNPHCFGIGGDGTTNDSVNGGYAEKIGTGNDGDLFLGGPVGATTTTFSNVVSTCSTVDGYSIGTFNNITTASPGTVVATQNTICGKEPPSLQGVGMSAEITNVVAGQNAGTRNNIVFCATNTNCYLVHKGPTGTPAAGAYANVDYNWKWNVSVGPYLNVGAMYSPNPPGAHDSSGDPQFVQQRHFLDWGQMLKPSISTWTDIVAEFAKMNDDVGYDSRFNLLDCYNWLRAGYVPRNAAVYSAGDTGGQVGAKNLIPSMVAGPAKIAGPGAIR